MANLKPTSKGMPVFVPTDEQRQFVSDNAGFHMTWDEICAQVINPRTGKPISKETLGKAFAEELALGKARLKTLIHGAYIDKLKAKDWNAIQWGLKQICDYPDNVSASMTFGQGASSIEVVFVKAQPQPKVIEGRVLNGNGHDV